MATIVKTPSGTWEAVIRKTGWPTSSKTFRTKRDAEDQARRTKDEMVRGVYIQRAPGERMTLHSALTRYLREVTPSTRESTRASAHKKAQPPLKLLGKYSLAALSVMTNYNNVARRRKWPTELADSPLERRDNSH